MELKDWRVRGPEIATCNCSWGCPCQFNALPTFGNCRAAVAMRIDDGYYGDTSLKGLTFVGLFAWPGAIHHGSGEVQAIIDEHATPAQREALLAILSGQAEATPRTIFAIMATTITTMHEPLFRPITFEVDREARTGSFAVEGIVEGRMEPIRNPVTGAEHRARVLLPEGFEYRDADYASSTVEAHGKIAHAWAGRHAHVADLHLGPGGVM